MRGEAAMFGYIRAEVSELRVRESRFYQALYCGLCRRMGACTGNCSRLTLSYDAVFLASFRAALVGEPIALKKRRCLIHPLRARPMAEANAALDFAADAAALLTHGKILDDLSDERGWKRLRALLARPFTAIAHRRAKKRHPALDAAIQSHLQCLSAAEADPHATPDALAAEFGALMGELFSAELPSPEQARIAAAVGNALGRWLYLTDAADDLAEDIRRRRFNPFRSVFGEQPTEADLESLRLALTAHLCDAERGMALLEVHDRPELHAILQNILYLGLPAVIKRVTTERTAKSPDQTTKERVSKQHENSL